MPESDRTSPARRPSTDTYAEASRRPLASLVFLLPLVVAYEAGSIVYLSDAEGRPVGAIKAERLLGSIFEMFGVVGLALPAVLLVTVLLVWHVLEHRPWRVRPGVLAVMAAESLAWTLPLFVLAGLVGLLGTAREGLAQTAQESAALISGMDLGSRLTIALGAGLYEELLFRMIGVAVVHALAVDLLRAGEGTGRAAAVVLTALAFAWYHAPGTGLEFAYYALAGVLFGLVYLWRGFGIVAGMHALYDVVILVVLRG